MNDLTATQIRNVTELLESEGLPEEEALARAERIAEQVRLGVPYDEAVRSIGGVRGMLLLVEESFGDVVHDPDPATFDEAINDRIAAIFDTTDDDGTAGDVDRDLDDRIANIFRVKG